MSAFKSNNYLLLQNCNKNLLNEKVTIFFNDNKIKEPVNLLSTSHKPNDEYHSYLNDFSITITLVK